MCVGYGSRKGRDYRYGVTGIAGNHTAYADVSGGSAGHFQVESGPLVGSPTLGRVREGGCVTTGRCAAVRDEIGLGPVQLDLRCSADGSENRRHLLMGCFANHNAGGRGPDGGAGPGCLHPIAVGVIAFEVPIVV